MLLHPWLSFFWVKYPAEADDIIEPKPDIFSRTTAGTAKKSIEPWPWRDHPERKEEDYELLFNPGLRARWNICRFSQT